MFEAEPGWWRGRRKWGANATNGEEKACLSGRSNVGHANDTLEYNADNYDNGDGADDKAVGDGNNDDTWKGRQEPDHVEQVAMMIIW